MNREDKYKKLIVPILIEARARLEKMMEEDLIGITLEIKRPKRILKNSDYQKVVEFGERNQYPELILDANKKLGSGKENWDNALAWFHLKSPYRENFISVLDAIARYEKND